MRKLLALFFMLAPITVSAAPVCVKDTIQASRPYGQASLHKFFFHVYDAAYWTDGKGWDMNTSHALHLTYHVDIDADGFLERTIEELERNKDVTQAMLKQYQVMLKPIYPDVRDGDTITATYAPNSGLTFCHNDTIVGSVKGVTYIEPFMGIWLGKYSSEPSMRDTLLNIADE